MDQIRKPYMEIIISITVGFFFFIFTMKQIFGYTAYTLNSRLWTQILFTALIIAITYIICLVTIPRRCDQEFLLG